MAVLGNGIAKEIAHHCVFIAIGGIGIFAQVVVDGLECLGAVVIVGVDDGKGTVYYIAGGKGCVGGAPGLGAAFGHGVALGQVSELLIGVAHVYNLGKPVADGFLESILYLVLDDENNGFKSGTAGVVDGIVDYQLTVGPNGVDLLEAAVTAAHSRCHNYQYRLIHSFLPSIM